MKKTLVKYGKSGRSHVESVKFKQCELSYERSAMSANWYTYIPDDTLTMTPYNNKESVAAADFRTSLSNYSESPLNSIVNLAAIDTDKIEIIEKGKLTLVEIHSRDNADEDAIQVISTEKVAPSETRDKLPVRSTKYFNVRSVRFVVTDKKVANNVKDALGRVITLCQ